MLKGAFKVNKKIKSFLIDILTYVIGALYLPQPLQP